MKYLILLLLFAGCTQADNGAFVNITCYDKTGGITYKHLHYKGPFEVVNGVGFNYRSQKCVIERED